MTNNREVEDFNEDMEISEEDVDLDPNKLPKCKTCGRFTYGHAAPVGPKCSLKRIIEKLC